MERGSNSEPSFETPRQERAALQSLTQKAINKIGHWRLARHARLVPGIHVFSA
jgi:hypothetical protein